MRSTCGPGGPCSLGPRLLALGVAGWVAAQLAAVLVALAGADATGSPLLPSPEAGPLDTLAVSVVLAAGWLLVSRVRAPGWALATGLALAAWALSAAATPWRLVPYLALGAGFALFTRLTSTAPPRGDALGSAAAVRGYSVLPSDDRPRVRGR